ncbi:hypothetical protein FQV23_0012145, partial [Spheniscus humboldti]
KQCSFFFLCFNSTSEMTTFVIVLSLVQQAIRKMQLLQMVYYKTFCKKKSSEELIYLNTP